MGIVRQRPHLSQNARFQDETAVAADRGHPKGYSYIARLSEGLLSRGWQVGDPENWRDCGWSCLCAKGSGRLLLIISSRSGPEWVLQISPEYVPGFVARLLGGTASASDDDMFALATDVDAILRGAGTCSGLMWRWDGRPEEGTAQARPPRR